MILIFSQPFLQQGREEGVTMTSLTCPASVRSSDQVSVQGQQLLGLTRPPRELCEILMAVLDPGRYVTLRVITGGL